MKDGMAHGWTPPKITMRDVRQQAESQVVPDPLASPLLAAFKDYPASFTPEQKADQPVAYGKAVFSRDGKGIYITTDCDSDFQRLAYLDLATMTPRYLTTGISWDVEDFSLSEDGKTIAFDTNENGLS